MVDPSLTMKLIGKIVDASIGSLKITPIGALTLTFNALLIGKAEVIDGGVMSFDALVVTVVKTRDKVDRHRKTCQVFHASRDEDVINLVVIKSVGFERSCHRFFVIR